MQKQAINKKYPRLGSVISAIIFDTAWTYATTKTTWFNLRRNWVALAKIENLILQWVYKSKLSK